MNLGTAAQPPINLQNSFVSQQQMAYMPLNMSPQKSMGSPSRTNADVDRLVGKYVAMNKQSLPIPLKRLGNEKDGSTVIYEFGTQQV